MLVSLPWKDFEGFPVVMPAKAGIQTAAPSLALDPAFALGDAHIVATTPSIPPLLVGGGEGAGFARRARQRVMRACRRKTPPPTPAHKGRGNGPDRSEDMCT